MRDIIAVGTLRKHKESTKVVNTTATVLCCFVKKRELVTIVFVEHALRAYQSTALQTIKLDLLLVVF